MCGISLSPPFVWFSFKKVSGEITADNCELWTADSPKYKVLVVYENTSVCTVYVCLSNVQVVLEEIIEVVHIYIYYSYYI